MCKLEKSSHPESVRNFTQVQVLIWCYNTFDQILIPGNIMMIAQWQLCKKMAFSANFLMWKLKKISTSLSTLVGVNLHDHMKNQWRTKLWKCTQQRCKFAQSVSKLPVYTLQKCNYTHIRFSVCQTIRL